MDWLVVLVRLANGCYQAIILIFDAFDRMPLLLKRRSKLQEQKPDPYHLQNRLPVRSGLSNCVNCIIGSIWPRTGADGGLLSSTQHRP